MKDADVIAAWMGKRTETIPLWLMRQAGRYLPEYRQTRALAGSFLELVYNPKLAAEVTLQPLNRFDLDAAILFSDILVVPHALGMNLTFAEGEGPRLDAIAGKAGLVVLNEKDALGKLAPIMETVAMVRDALPKNKALIGFAGSPWTVASYMVEGRGGHDFGVFKGWAANDPDGFQQMLDVVVRVTVTYLDAQIKAGAEAVQLFESWAGALSGADFDRWVIAPNKAIVTAIRALHPVVPIIGFPRTDNLVDVQHFASQTGVDTVAVSQGVTPQWAARNLQGQLCVQGNLAPELLLEGGSAMLDAAQAICEGLDGGPFVFNLGHGVIKETDPAHVGALVDCVHSFKRRALAA